MFSQVMRKTPSMPLTPIALVIIRVSLRGKTDTNAAVGGLTRVEKPRPAQLASQHFTH